MKIEGKTVLITGATGFVGNHLAEHLVLSDKQIKVRGLVHNPINAVRLARLPVEMIVGDMTSLAQVREAMRGCDVVVHCAVGSYGTYHATVRGTENLLKTAYEFGVKRFIHISSCSVYSYKPDSTAIFTGRISYDHVGDPYCDSKIDAEKIVFQYYEEKKVPTVVLRPTHIFGPYSYPWTIMPIEMIKRRSYVLINGGNSPSNVIYIGNIIHAIKLAITKDQAIGEAVIISGDKLVTWREFFSAYAHMLHPTPPLLNIALDDIENERARQRVAVLNSALTNPKRIPNLMLNTLNYKLSGVIGKNKVSELKSSLYRSFKIVFSEGEGNSSKIIPDNLPDIPDDNKIKEFTTDVRFTNSDAERILGYAPVVCFEQGMKLTEEWLRFQGLLL